jgi:hypothetical protein
VGLPAALARHGSVEAVALVSLTLLPSAPALLIAWAKTQTDLAAIQGTRVGTRLNATLPASRVQRVSGTPTDPWQDLPVLQVEAWAADEATADLLIRTLGRRARLGAADHGVGPDLHLRDRLRAVLGAGRPEPVEQQPVHLDRAAADDALGEFPAVRLRDAHHQRPVRRADLPVVVHHGAVGAEAGCQLRELNHRLPVSRTGLWRPPCRPRGRSSPAGRTSRA